VTREIKDDIIIQPTIHRPDGHTVYTFTFRGCIWFYFASSHAPPPKLLPVGTLSTGGELVVRTQDYMTHSPLVEAFNRFIENTTNRPTPRHGTSP